MTAHEAGRRFARAVSGAGRRRLVPAVVAVTAVLGMGASACSGGSSPAAATPSTLTLALGAGPATLDPAKDANGYQSTMRALSNASITHLNPDGSISPGLATSYRYVGTGNRQFEFTLRHDARFADGKAVTAAAVKAWLEYFAKAGGPFVTAMGRIESIDTRGDWTVQIHLADPNAAVPYLLSEAMNWGSVSGPAGLADPKKLGTSTDGAGPYTVQPDQSVAGNHYTFVPNPHYPDKSRIKYKKIVVKIIESAQAMLGAVRSGQVDVATGDKTTADSAALVAGERVLRAPTGFDGLTFLDRSGKTSKPLGDVRVRRALNYAVDRASIVKALFGKYGSRTSQVTSTDGYDPGYEDHYAYDPAKAKSLLAAAGYRNGFTLKVVNFQDPLAPAIAKYLGNVGVKVDVTTAATFSQFYQDALGGRFPAMCLSFGSTPIGLFYESTLRAHAPANPQGVVDSTLESLFLKGSSATGTKQAGDYWKQMSQRITTEADFLPVVRFYAIYYVSKRVAGVSIGRTGVATFPTDWSPR